MSVFYKLYQDNRNNSSKKGQWYARAVTTDTVTTDDLADIMQNNCTVKRSDILAVISELVETMKTEMQNSRRVKLDRFGTFKIGLSSKPSPTVKDFNAAKNIHNLHVLFQPELKIDKNHKRNKQFLTGLKFRNFQRTTLSRKRTNERSDNQ